MQSEFSIGTGPVAFLSPRAELGVPPPVLGGQGWHGLCCPSLALCPSCVVLCWQQCWLCWVVAFPCAVPGGSRGSSRCRQPGPSRGGTAGAALPPFLGSPAPSPVLLQLFIHRDERMW